MKHKVLAAVVCSLLASCTGRKWVASPTPFLLVIKTANFNCNMAKQPDVWMDCSYTDETGKTVDFKRITVIRTRP